VARPSPLDALDPAQIPELERCPDLPQEAVAVIGTHRGRIYGSLTCLAFTPDGCRLVTGDSDGGLRFWDPATLQERAALPAAQAVVQSFAFSPDGTRLAVVSTQENLGLFSPLFSPGDAALEIWAVGENGFSLRNTLDFKGQVLNAVAWSPDGAALVVGGGRTKGAIDLSLEADMGWVQIYGVRNDELSEWATFTQFNGPARALAFSPDGAVLAAGGTDSGVRLWDFAELTPEARQRRTTWLWTMLKVAAPLAVLLLVLGTLAFLVGRYNLRGWRSSRWFQTRIRGAILVVAIALVLAVSGAVWQWAHLGPPDPRTCAEEKEEPPKHSISSLAFSADGRMLVAGISSPSADARIGVWRRQGDGWERSSTLAMEAPAATGNGESKAPPKSVAALAFSPDGTRLVACGSVRRWWRIERDAFWAGEELGEGSAKAVAFSPDGRLLASEDALWRNSFLWRTAQIGIWEVDATGFRRSPPPPGVAEFCDASSLRFSRDGSPIAIVLYHRLGWQRGRAEAQVWTLDGTVPLRRAVMPLEGGGFREAFEFARDGGTLFWQVEGRGRLWDVRRQPTAPLAEWESRRASALSPDGTALAIPGKDGIMRLFDVLPSGLREVAAVGAFRDDGRESAVRQLGPRLTLPPLLPLNAGVLKPARFSQDGDRLTVIGADGKNHLWDARARPPRELATSDPPSEEKPANGQGGQSPGPAVRLPGRDGRSQMASAPDGRHAIVTIEDGPLWILRLQEYDDLDRLYASCDEVLSRDPKNVAALLGRGRAHLEKGRYDEALADAEAALRHGGGAEAYRLRGLARAEKGDYAGAKADLDKAFKLDPRLEKP
jgi:WD40 repeat protein